MNRKLFTTALMLLMAFMAQAQVKIAPKMEKGMKMTYSIVTTATAAGQEMKTDSEVEYVVSQKNADGFVVDVTMTKMESADNSEDLMSRMMNITEEMMKGVTIKIKTDKDGKPVGIVNSEEVKTLTLKTATKMLDEIYQKSPEISQVLSKETMMKQVEETLTEEAILNSYLATATNALVLNGKTVANMAQDTYTSNQKIPMKRMYFVAKDGKTITTNSQSEMTKEELKKFIIKQVEDNMPNQAEMIKQNIDAVMESGMLKIEAKEKAVYTMQDNGWIKSVDMTQELNMMGQSMTQKAVMTLK